MCVLLCVTVEGWWQTSSSCVPLIVSERFTLFTSVVGVCAVRVLVALRPYSSRVFVVNKGGGGSVIQ